MVFYEWFKCDFSSYHVTNCWFINLLFVIYKLISPRSCCEEKISKVLPSVFLLCTAEDQH